MEMHQIISDGDSERLHELPEKPKKKPYKPKPYPYVPITPYIEEKNQDFFLKSPGFFWFFSRM